MAAPELSDSEVLFLQELTERKVRFLVVGLFAAALQGAPVVTQDVDLWFEDLHDPNLRHALQKVGGSYVPPIEMNPPMFAGGGLNLFDIVLRMDGLKDFQTEFAGRLPLKIRGSEIPVLPLDRIIVSKRASNRPKDALYLKTLEDITKLH